MKCIARRVVWLRSFHRPIRHWKQSAIYWIGFYSCLTYLNLVYPLDDDLSFLEETARVSGPKPSET